MDENLKVKQVYLSFDNSQHILNYVYDRVKNLFKSNDDLQFNIETHKRNILDIQNNIFENYFNEIYKKIKVENNYQNPLEQMLILLNKLTMNTLENIIKKEIEKNLKDNVDVDYTNSNKNFTNSNKDYTNSNKDKNKYKEDKDKEDKDKDKDKDKDNDVTELICKYSYSHFFSKAKNVKNENKSLYTFPFFLNNVNCINLQEISINCNIYNIDENINYFIIDYQNESRNILIPIGFYKIDQLLNCITNLLNNEFKTTSFKVYKNIIKNKIHFTLNENESTFNIMFNTSLNKILGFNNSEYKNNNVYVSENFPINNLFDTLFLKLYINNQSLDKYTSFSNEIPSYFNLFGIDMEYYYGKNYKCTFVTDPFDLNPVEINSIGIEFISKYNFINLSNLDFDFILNFEYY